jgi:hypothetical protein
VLLYLIYIRHILSPIIYQNFIYEKIKKGLKLDWSLAFREEQRLRMFKYRVPRRIFGCKWDGIIGGWRKLHNEELHYVYSSPNGI